MQSPNILTIRRRPSDHIIQRGELSDFLKRRFPHLPMFVYRHAKTHNWVIACWADKSEGTFVELMAMPDPSGFTREDMTRLDGWANHRFMSNKEWAALIRSHERSQANEALDDQARTRDRNRFMGRKLGSDHPFFDSSGGFPVDLQYT
jgi:hypothetical protein